MGSFKQARAEEAHRVDYSAGEPTQADQGARGLEQDRTIASLKAAAKEVAGPYTCSDDALDLIGVDYQMQRFEGEANGSAPDPSVPGSYGTGYRGRLCAAWTAREAGGAKLGLKTSLQAWGGGGDVDITNYHQAPFDLSDNWSQFWVTLGPNFGAAPISQQFWGSFTWGEETWGSTATTLVVEQVKRQVLELKWAYSVPRGVVLDFGASTYAFWRMANFWGLCRWGGSTWAWGNRTWSY